MSDHEATFTRRVFLEQGMTLASMAATAPLFIQRSALGIMKPQGSPLASQPGVPEDRILVVVQLGGGNDGLNTVIPYSSRRYYNARPGLAVPAPGDRSGRQSAIQLDEGRGIGLHPAMTGFKELIDDGVAGIVQGVGYPNPNRSHFTSMDIWQTADTTAKGYGWIGRYFDNACSGTPVPEGEVAIGRTAPLAMQGALHKPVTFESAELFRWLGERDRIGAEKMRALLPDHPVVEDLKLKQFTAMMSLSESDACAPDFLARFAKICTATSPYMQFLTQAVGLEW